MRDYVTIRSARRTLSLEIGSGGVITVRAPLKCSDGEISAFVASHEKWIEKYLRIAAERVIPNPTPEQAEKLRNLAREIIPEKVKHYAAIMGVMPTGIKITSAKTRFGSCSGKNSLCFSYLLMLYPDEAIDAVVVHELAHIRHHNHGKNFYAFVYEYMPDYDRRKLLLRKIAE